MIAYYQIRFSLHHSFIRLSTTLEEEYKLMAEDKIRLEKAMRAL
jgi:hypothetical protein